MSLSKIYQLISLFGVGYYTVTFSVFRMAHPYMSEFSESIWFEKWRVDDAEKNFQEKLAGTGGAIQV